MSTSQIDKNRRLLAYKKAIDRRNKRFDAITPHYCVGCGSHFRLSRAHIIRISLHKELEFDLENIAFLCMSGPDKVGCHTIWDDGTLEEKRKLCCFDRFMKYIKEQDELLYNRILNL